jgi:hypothetical protein
MSNVHATLDLRATAEGGVRRSVIMTEQHRYVLTQAWGDERSAPRHVAFIMLNPSTADGQKDDPTLRRCRAFAQALGFTGLQVANLYAFKATDPKQLKLVDLATRLGAENDTYVKLVANRCHYLIAAWGRRPSGLRAAEHQARIKAVRAILARTGKPVWCLGRTKALEPRHPLMLPKSSRPMLYQEES